MAIKIFALLMAAVIGISHSLPALDPNDVELIGRDDVPDYPQTSLGFFPEFRLPDFSAIQDYMNRVRATIAGVLSEVTQDAKKGNTTSETKIIDGNRVTVNRTIYSDDGVYVVVKNVDIRPDESANGSTLTISDTSATTASTREDIETFGEPANERGNVYSNLEPLEVYNDMGHRPANNLDVESIETFHNFDELPIERDLTNDIYVNQFAARPLNNEDVEEFDANSLNEVGKQQLAGRYLHASQPVRDIENVEDVEEVIHDLSGDTYVNALLERKLEADWERGYRRRGPMPLPAAYNAYTVSDTDVPSDYRDLSRDTYVNELAARRGTPTDPDAEQFDVEFSNSALRKRHS